MFKKIVRKDGLTIILVPKADTKAATFQVLYKVGSRQENATNNGVSHFVEHLMFKGTQKRPNTGAISRELDSVGAEYNAFTGKDYTGYYIKASSENIGLSVDMLSDMLHNSLFDSKLIDPERGVIIEEINMYEDNPLMHVGDVFENLLYQGTTLGKSIAGPRKNIQNISRSALYNYHKKYYYNGNTIIGVAGKFDAAKVLALINKYFPVSGKSPRVKANKVVLKKQNSPRVSIVKRDLEQVQLILGFKSPSEKDKRYLTSQVLANIMGGNMSSRLFLNIREKRGLCYFIRGEINGYEDISSLTVHAGLNKTKIYEALKAIKELLHDLKAHGVSKEEVIKAKKNLRGHLILRLEDSTNYLSFLMSQEFLGQEIKSLEAKLLELDKISLGQVNKLAQEIIDWRLANLAIIGPFASQNKFLNILKN